MEFGPVCEGDFGSSFVNALHPTNHHLLVPLRLGHRERRGEAKHCD